MDQPDGAVTERRDGTLAVVGVLTPDRARLIARGLATPPAAVGVGLLVLGLALLLALLRGAPALALLDLLLLAVLAWVALTGPSRVARRLLASAGPDPVTWTYSPRGLAIEGTRGKTELPWSRVRGLAVVGDMLVVRTAGARAVTGGLVGPLTPQQRDRVLGWAAAAEGTGRPARPPAR